VRRSLASVVQPLAVLALAGAVFAAWMHLAVLDPTNIGWLLDGNDRGANAVGTAAYLKAGRWPLLNQPLLSYPQGLALLFTDSVPLIGFLAKPFGVEGVQLVGLWYLACVLLQAGFAWALVGRHARDPLTRWLGAALLTFVPVLLNRYGHPSLCAQWLILWGLWIHVDERRAASPWWWLAVLATAAMVHSYLLVMVAALWGTTVLRRLATEPRRGRVVAQLAILLPIAGIVAGHGVFGGGFVSTRSYGSWPLALDAWWNPANPDYSALLPASPDHGDALGFEGLQYLGAGLLGLVIVAVAILAVRRSIGAEGRRLLWLIPAFTVLALIAIGPAPIWRGEPLFRLPMPRGLIDLLDPVRAAGRFGWPITYTAIYAAVAIVARTRRATLLLGAALALQVVDLSGMAAAIRSTSARAEDRTLYTRTRDPRWATLIARAGSIDFEPPAPFGDLQLMEEVAWRAVAACRPVRYFYAARDARAVRTRTQADAAAFRAGRLDPTRLYIVLSGPVPAPVASRAITIDGVAVVPPSAPAPPSLCVSASSPRSAS